MTPQYYASELLAFYEGDEARWTQQAFGRDDADRSLPTDDIGTEGVCWCISGAAMVIGFDLRAVATALGFKSVLAMEQWNDADKRTFADVVALLERIAAEPTP